MEIEHINLDKMRNSANLAYHYDFIKTLLEHPAITAKIASLGEYQQLCDELDAAYKSIVKSPLTDPIREADSAMDETWMGIVHYIEAYLRHPDPVMQEHARRLNIVSNTYGKSKLSSKSLIEQTTDIINIVQDFEGPYAADATAIGLLPLWVVELKARNITAKNLMHDRDIESGAKNHTILKEARARLDAKYYEIVKLINAFVLVEGPAVYEDLVNTANAKIAKYKILMAHSSKKPKKDAGDAKPEHKTEIAAEL